jgi:hypothetical protein
VDTINEQPSPTRGRGKKAENLAENLTEQEKLTARDKAEQSAYEPEYDSPTRRSSEARANAFNPLAWVVEGATGVAEEVRHSDLGLSEEFWVHLYAMRREGLLAARAAVNSLLAKIERERPTSPEQTTRQTRRGEVTIEITKP